MAGWPTDVALLAPDDFSLVFEAGGDLNFLLLGCGAEPALPPEALHMAFAEAGIGLEPMDTGAACRTYNVLLAEGRPVGAALIAVD